MKRLIFVIGLLCSQLSFAADALRLQIGNPDPFIAWAITTASSAGVNTTPVLTNANDAVAQCQVAEKADTITHIGYHQGTTVGAGAAYTVSLEGTVTGGAPNTTITRIGGVTVTTFNPTGSGGANDNTWQWISLGANTYTLTQGQEYCIVIRRTGANDGTTMIVNSFINVAGHPGYPVAHTAAANVWARAGAATIGLLGVKSATEVYGRPWTGSVFSANYPTGQLTESGSVFTLPTTLCSTAKVKGIKASFRSPGTSATDTWVATLYSAPTTAPVRLSQSTPLITDRFYSNAGILRELEMFFTTSPTITCGVQYGAALATTSINQTGMYYTDVATASDWNAWSFKQNAAFMTRVLDNTGNNNYAGIVAGTVATSQVFTTTATRRMYMDLILEDLTPPSGSIGGVF